MEGDEYLRDRYGRDHHKRPRISSDSNQQQDQWGMEYMNPQRYHPLDEPSPLGLELRESPTLVNQIQTHLAQAYGNTIKTTNSAETISSGPKESKRLAFKSDELKASTIPASILRIGNWEYKAINEGELMAKIYFMKHRLVWEILESGLKNKIEFQWSDISGFKAECPEFGESSLKVVLARQPLFFREIDPHPRKHTLWQTCSDFTNGEASVNRIHFIKFPEGLLLKHYEMLVQSDDRLNFLSRQPDMIVYSPFFESSLSSLFEDLNPSSHFVSPMKAGESALNAGFPGSAPPTATTAVKPPIFQIERQGRDGKMAKKLPIDSFSPDSVMTIDPNERLVSQTGEFKKPAGLHHTMSNHDLVNSLENMINQDPDLSFAEVARHNAQPEDVAELLLNDSDNIGPLLTDEASGMVKNDSLSDLLNDLPYIASLPKLMDM